MFDVLKIEELIATTSLTAGDFIDGGDVHYSMSPTFLDYSLNTSLKKLNVATLDCAFLHNCYESGKRKYRSDQEWQHALSMAFEFYERMVSENKIRSYGITGNQALRFDPELVNKIYKQPMLEKDDLEGIRKFSLDNNPDSLPDYEPSIRYR